MEEYNKVPNNNNNNMDKLDMEILSRCIINRCSTIHILSHNLTNSNIKQHLNSKWEDMLSNKMDNMAMPTMGCR